MVAVRITSSPLRLDHRHLPLDSPPRALALKHPKLPRPLGVSLRPRPLQRQQPHHTDLLQLRQRQRLDQLSEPLARPLEPREAPEAELAQGRAGRGRAEVTLLSLAT